LSLDKFSYNCYYEKIGKNEPIKLEDLPFKIPENWAWIRLKNIVCIETGKKDANFGSIDGNYNFYTCALEPIKSKSYTYDGEYLILPGNGANIGKSIHFIGKFEAYQRTYLLSKVFSILNFKYLKYVLDIFWESWNKNKMFGSAIPYIKLINLEKFIIPFPPLDEQERIVKKIQSLDLLIQKYNEYETKLTKLENEFEEKLKKSILQYAIQGKLVKQDPNDEPASELVKKIYDEKQKLILERKIKQDKYESHIYQGTDKNYYEKIDENEPIKLEDLPFKIPENWTWVRFSNFVNFELGHTPSRDMNENWQPGKYPWFSISDMKDKKNIYFSKEKISELAFKKYFSSKLVPKNTLLMSFKLTIGRVSLLGVNATHNEAITSISPYLDQNNYIKIYLFNILGTLVNFVSQTQAIKGKILNKEKLKKMFIPVPCLKEISKINNKIRLFFNLIK